MRLPPRHILPLLIAGLPALAGGCVEAVIDTDCVDTVDRSFEIQTPADTQLQFKIESCRVDSEACPDLCRVTLQRNNINDVPTRCEVRFHTASVDVKAWYEVYVGGDSCPGEVFDDGGVVFAAPPSSRFDSRVVDARP